MVDSFYEGKCVLITGCTGFVGKVILEKLLFALPQIQRIYTIIRPKKGSSILERFQKEIIRNNWKSASYFKLSLRDSFPAVLGKVTISRQKGKS